MAQRLAAATRLPDAIDLSESNPTRAGLAYDPELLLSLANPAGLVYEPSPLGLPGARLAIARYLARVRDLPVDADALALTASTSEAYALLFKCVCDPGDAVAIPTPSYPLLTSLLELEGVRPLAYRLVYDGRWQIDLDSVRAALVTGARALVLIQPNNPTGSCAAADELHAVAALCREQDALLIADEVFAPYGSTGPVVSVARTLDAAALGITLCVLDGLAKSVLLPQLKLAWTVFSGVGATALRERWAHAADALLSVGTPVQIAAAALLARAPAIQTTLRARLAENLATLDARLLASSAGVQRLARDAGWYVVLRLPRLLDEETWVLHLAEEQRVIVQPGFWYDFASEAYVVVSLLVPPERFATGIERLLAAVFAAARAPAGGG